MGETYCTHEAGEECFQNFVRKIRRKKTAWKTWHRWQDNIRMDWIHLAQDRGQLQVLVKQLSGSIKGKKFLD